MCSFTKKNFLCLSDAIKDEVINFLRARTDSNVLAKQCYMRLVKMITHGRRTYPPHIAEVQAIQVKFFKILTWNGAIAVITQAEVFYPLGPAISHLYFFIGDGLRMRCTSQAAITMQVSEKQWLDPKNSVKEQSPNHTAALVFAWSIHLLIWAVNRWTLQSPSKSLRTVLLKKYKASVLFTYI